LTCPIISWAVDAASTSRNGRVHGFEFLDRSAEVSLEMMGVGMQPPEARKVLDRGLNAGRFEAADISERDLADDFGFAGNGALADLRVVIKQIAAVIQPQIEHRREILGDAEAGKLAAVDWLAGTSRLEAGSTALIREAILAFDLATISPRTVYVADIASGDLVAIPIVKPKIVQTTWMSLGSHHPPTAAADIVARLIRQLAAHQRAGK
jgi:DNA-binding transcriptional LysR family regulator